MRAPASWRILDTNTSTGADLVDHITQRTVLTLRLGARLGLVAAALVLVFAAYHVWTPIDITGSGGVQFNCGSVIDPPAGVFQVGNCGTIVDRQRMIVIFSGIAAVVIAAGSVYAFGLDRRREQVLTHDDETSRDYETSREDEEAEDDDTPR